jgi:hypothetical protein
MLYIIAGECNYRKRMRCKINSCILLLALIFLTLSFNSLEAHASSAIVTDISQQESSQGMDYAFVSVTLNSLDLSLRKVNFSLSGSFGFNYDPLANLTVRVSTFGTYVGDIKLIEIISGQNSSQYVVSADASSLSGYLRGGPEMYPFDHYEFNFTLDLFLPTTQIFANTTIDSSCQSVWPLRAQFDGPLDVSNSTTQTPIGPSISISCGINRPLWQGNATLLPIYLMFALIGSLTLIETKKREMTFRLSVCLAVLTSALAYIFSVQNTLPIGRFYLSIPEVLVYSVIGSLTIFIIFSLVSHGFIVSNTRRIITDAAASVFSIALMGFMFLTFYTNSTVAIYTYSYSNVLRTESIISMFSFSGLLFLIVRWLYHLVKSTRNRQTLGGCLDCSRVDSLSKGIYAIGYALGAYLLIIVFYIRWSLGTQVATFDPSPALISVSILVIFGTGTYILRRVVSTLKSNKHYSSIISDVVGSAVFAYTFGYLILVLYPALPQGTLSAVQMSMLIFFSLIFIGLRNIIKASSPQTRNQYVV